MGGMKHEHASHGDILQIGVKQTTLISINLLIRTTIFEWYLVGCSSKNGYEEDRCLKDIELRFQNKITILNPT